MVDRWMQRETIQSGWLDDLGLIGRKLHNWCDLIGATPKGHAAGKWRRFSPLHVLRFSTLSVLKSRTGLPISQGNLLPDYVTGNAFVAKSLELWKEGRRPILFTDFAETVGIEDANAALAPASYVRSRVMGFVDIEKDIAYMVRAVHQGGDEDQRHRLALLFAKRREAIRAKGQRQLDLGASSVPAADEEIEDYIQQTLAVTA